MYYGLSPATATTPDEAQELHTDAQVPAALLRSLRPNVRRYSDGYRVELAHVGYWGRGTAPTLDEAIGLAFADLIQYVCSASTQQWLNANAGGGYLAQKHGAAWEARGSR